MLQKFFSGAGWNGNIYRALVLSLLLVMALYTVGRLGFFFFNLSFFPGMTLSRMFIIMLGGLRFDLTATLYSNSLFILLMIVPVTVRFHRGYQQFLHWLFIVVNAIAFAINTADIIYYRFTLRRTTLSIMSQFKNEENLGRLAFRFLFDYWYAVLFWLVTVAILYYVKRRIKYDGPQLRHKPAFFVTGALAMLLSIYLFVGGARGGFRGSTRPITLSNAAAYVETPNEISLVLNTPFALMRTAKASVIKKVHYFSSEEEMNKVFNPVREPVDTTAFRPMNVVVIILESFSREFMGAYNRDVEGGHYKGYTPFLDSLVRVSNAFQYSFANGRKSIDAMPSVISSIPSIEVSYVLSHFSGNKVDGLAGLLKQKGYQTAFFHGAPNGSMGFDAYANLSGFEQYFGKSEYNNDSDFDGYWGIWDEPFLQFFGDKVNAFRTPFFATLFTVSSHHPFNLPEGYEDKFKGGPKPVQRTVEYTDYALRRFFRKASAMPWYQNTLFVITADHAAGDTQLPEYNTAWGYFSIPVFFFRPGENGGGIKAGIAEQIDIMPSVLGYLHFDKPFVAFGRDVFHDPSRPFAVNYLDNTYQIFRGDYFLQFDGTRSTALFRFKEDKMLKTNLVAQLPDTARAMELLLKAFIQQYNNRMVDNSLTPGGNPLNAGK